MQVICDPSRDVYADFETGEEVRQLSAIDIVVRPEWVGNVDISGVYISRKTLDWPEI